jgi:kynurenine formamidase
MCPPEVLKAMQDPAMSRRSLLKLGLATVGAVGVALHGAPAQAQEAPLLRWRKVHDLTHALSPAMPVFPGAPRFQRETVATHEADGYYGNILTYWEHIGTHMDAPIHFAPDGLSVEQIPPESLVVPAVVIDISQRAAREPATTVTADDIRAWERRHGVLPTGAAVLMHSGWAARIGSEAAYQNKDSSGVMHFPGFSEEAIRFLLAERSISGVGVDTLSLDHGPSTTFAAHLAILSSNRWGLENLASLSEIPPKGATLFVGAPNVAAGSGGPARVLAVW